MFTLVRIISYLTIQSLLTRWLLSKLQLKNVFLIQPFCSLAAAFCTLAIPSLGGSIAGVVLQKMPQYTIDETARKTIQCLIPEERRGRVCLFMDSYLVAIGAIIAAVLTSLIIVIGEALSITKYFYIYSAIALVSSIVAIVAIFRVRSVYDSSLFNWRLKRRQRAKSVLDKIDF